MRQNTSVHFNMKHTLSILFCLFTAFSIRSQVVSNVRAELVNDKVTVHYALQSETPANCFLSYSADGGRTFHPCVNVSGDLWSQTSGNKTIIWDNAADNVAQGTFFFKVEAQKVEQAQTNNKEVAATKHFVTKTDNWYIPWEFGIDGAAVYSLNGAFGFDLGIFRLTKNFPLSNKSCIGWDIVKLKYPQFVSCEDYSLGSAQILSGAKFNTKRMGNKISFYTAIRLGMGWVGFYRANLEDPYGMNDYDYVGWLPVFELEGSVNFNRFFVGATFNGVVGGGIGKEGMLLGLRLGVNLGKKKAI